MKDYYDIIRRARAVLAPIPKREPSAGTRADYARKVAVLQERSKDHGGGLFDGAIAEALKTRKKMTWQASRAALLYSARIRLEGALRDQDRVKVALDVKQKLGLQPDWSVWKKLVQDVGDCTQGLEAVLNAKLPLEGRIERHTKRQDMKGLPVNWRERVEVRLPQYKPATLTAAVTGCRPAELVNGVEMSIEGNMLIAYIEGVKVL